MYALATRWDVWMEKIVLASCPKWKDGDVTIKNCKTLAISAYCLSDNMLLLSMLAVHWVRLANISMTCIICIICNAYIDVYCPPPDIHCLPLYFSFLCFLWYPWNFPTFSNIANIAMTCTSRYIAHHRISNHFSSLSIAPQVFEVLSLDQKIFSLH